MLVIKGSKKNPSKRPRSGNQVRSMKTKVIIYDCDGVLFDSRRSNYAFYNHFLERFGMASMTAAQARLTYVMTTVEALSMLFDGTPHLRKALEYAATVLNDEFVAMMDMEPNLRETLERLRRSYRIAIATNRGKSMFQVLKDHHVEDLFDMVVTSVDVEQPKPSPECLLKIMRRFEARPEECVYIGDAHTDLLVAQRAEVPFVAYKNTALEAWAHIVDHMELLTLLNRRPPE